MITIVRISGGLGNQIFFLEHIARIYATSKIVIIDMTSYESNKESRIFHLNEEISSFLKLTPLIAKIFLVLKRAPGVIGLLQKFKIQYVDQIDLNTENFLIEDYANFSIFRNHENLSLFCNDKIGAIHVRKGDFEKDDLKKLYQVCGIDYYRRGVEKLKSVSDVCHFVVFTDDKDWVNRHFDKLNISWEFANYGSDVDDFVTLARFRRVILSNSTFSFCAAEYLDHQKIIIAPFTWFNPDMRKTKFANGRASWIRIE